MLSNYAPFQIEMVVISSLLELNLLSTEQIVEYADNLLSTGYYDDALLEISEDDPIYPSVAKASAFSTAINNLGFPNISKEHAYWILSYTYMYNLTVRPHNYRIFEIYSLYGSLFFEDWFEFEPALNVEVFKNLLYQIDDALPLLDGYVQLGFNDAKTLLKLQSDFFILCENWLTEHSPKIESILQNLYA